MNWRQLLPLGHSLTLRLSLAFAVLACLVFAGLGIYLSRSADAHMAELDAHELLGKLSLARHIGQREATPAAMAARLGDALIGEHGMIVSVVGKEQVIFRWPADERSERLVRSTWQVGEKPQRFRLNASVDQGSGDFRVVAGRVDSAWGESLRVVVARDIGHHTDFLDHLQRDFWLAMLAATVLTAAVGLLIARRGLRPVRDIAHAAGRISAGQLAERIPEGGVPPELVEMVSAFNAMLARLEDSFSRLSDFSADLAHELRTPIHSLRMQTEVSLGKERSSEEYRELLASNLEEYERLARIIGDMLFLAKAEHGLLVPQREAVDLLALGRRLNEYYGILADKIELQLQGDAVTVFGDRLMLERAIGNLLINAIKHTPPAGRIILQIAAEDATAVVSVINSGGQIPHEALANIFDRFVRLSADSESNGLGLAITRSIIVAHGGSITAQSTDQITEFLIRIPL